MSGWRTYVLAASVATAIAFACFLSHRNREFVAAQKARAMAAASAVVRGEKSPDAAVAGRVTAEESGSQPFLRRRALDGRALGGVAAEPTDKLVYDAAARAERGGPFAEMLAGGDHFVAAIPIAGAVAVAVTDSSTGPAPLPALLLLALLGAGALVSFAGRRAGGAAAPLGLFIGASALALPCYWWAGPYAAAAVVLNAAVFATAAARGWLARLGAELREARAAYTFLAPTAIAMGILVAIPFAVGLALGFYNHHAGRWTFVGIQNFVHLLWGSGRSLADPLNFWFTLGVTVAWTAVNVALHLAIGVALAMLLRQHWLGGKGVFRVLLILPWAIPNYITALIWRGMFQSEYGAINAILESVGVGGVSWFSSWATAFSANVCTNTWLGFPFMMVVALGALESIPTDMYEAAEVDGASPWQRFLHITVPHLRPALGPAIALGAIWTFNMFNVIYLVSEGRPGGSTDILVTEAYRWAFERGERYGLAAAYATLIFIILLSWTSLASRWKRWRTS